MKVLLIGLLTALGFIGNAFAKPVIIHQETTQYQNIIVTQSGDIRCLIFNEVKRHEDHFQSCVNLKAPNELLLKYSKMIMASLFVNKKPERILIVGLGGGVLPNLFSNILPDAFIESVEIDPAVSVIAEKYFFNVPDKQNRFYVGDGRKFIQQALKKGVKYDLIILDAFNGEYIPEHLMTADFLTEAKSALTKNGVLAANTFSRSRLYEAESATYASVFGDFYNMKEERANRIIIATANGKPSVATVQDNARHYAYMFLKLYNVNVNSLLPMMSDVKDWPHATRIMTDQYSPANLLQDRKKNSFVDRWFFIIADFVKVSPIKALISFLSILVVLFLGITTLFDKYNKRRASNA